MNRLFALFSRVAFLRFAVIGACGFVVDTTVLTIDTHWLGMDRYSGRALSIFIAMGCTWLGNRLLTFPEHAARGSFAAVFHEWAKFAMANIVGNLINYCVYSLVISFAPPPANNQYVGLVCGTLVGMMFNFTLSKKLVFRKRA